MSPKPHAEESIWRPIFMKPDLVGYPGAAALHHVQVGDQSGYVDLILLPRTGPKKLVLVEAKRARDRRSSADVLGQLLKYYAHALDLGDSGVELLQEAAQRDRRKGRLLSFKELTHGVTPRGGQLDPRKLDLLVALDYAAPKIGPRLVKTATVLRELHGISVGVLVVESRSRVTWIYR